MLHFYSDLIGVTARTREEQRCGVVREIISSFTTGHTLGVLLQHPEQGRVFINKDQILQASKQEWMLRTCTVDQQPQESGTLYHLRVYTDDFQKYIGKVTDLELDGESWYLLAIEVKTPWWKLRKQGYIIPRKAITDISAKGINVDHIERYLGLPKEATAPLVEQLVPNSTGMGMSVKVKNEE